MLDKLDFGLKLTAPDFAGISHWINSDPISILNLRGKVVLIDFWTYSCINCVRTIPYLKNWYEKYHDKGLEIIGVHTPEFEFEKEVENVKKAVLDLGIKYPVALDSNYETWEAYANKYWPAKYFVDGRGKIREHHFGEGDYEKSEAIILELLREAGYQAKETPQTYSTLSPVFEGQTPETYLGLNRISSFSSPEKEHLGRYSYTFPDELPLDHFALEGEWEFSDEFVETCVGSKLRLHFRSKDVYLVLSSEKKTEGDVKLIHSKSTSKISVDGSKLYHVVSLNLPSTDILELSFEDSGVRLYAFTFGS